MTDTLRRGSIGAAEIVFFVVAAAAPLTAVLGVTPAAFAYGNGAAVPVVFLLVGAIYIAFSAAFTALSPHVASASGFYAYVTAGIGPRAGAATAAVALLSYQTISLSCYAVFGYFFAALAHRELNVDVPWWTSALALSGVVQACGRRAISFGGRLLAVCMTAEVAILLALCGAIFAHRTLANANPPSAALVFGPGLGVSIVFVVTSFIGFEATVVFGEEARDPARTIPRATYVAVLAIALFYALCTWAITLHYGPANIARIAAANPGEMYFAAIGALLGTKTVLVARCLMITSLFACILSFHATLARYLAAMARARLCPARLAAIHPRHGSPALAGLAQILTCDAAILVCALLRLDPYTIVFAWTGTLASLGILAMQVMTTLAVLGYYQRHRPTGARWRWTAAPIASGGALFACLVLVTMNLDLVSGSSSKAIFALPVLILLAAFAGGRGAQSRGQDVLVDNPVLHDQ